MKMSESREGGLQRAAAPTAIQTTTPKVELAMGAQGFDLTNLSEAIRFANMMVETGLMPKDMQTMPRVLLAMQLGFEVGLPPLAAIQNTAVINGRPSLYGDVVLGIVIASGKFDMDAFEETQEMDEHGMPISARCVVRRLPHGKPKIGTFTMKEAKLAGLMGKSGPWTTYPKRMMQFRARSFALRDAFPDLLKGIISAEEAMDIPPEERNVTPSPDAKPKNLDDLAAALGNSTAPATPAKAPREAAEVVDEAYDAMKEIHSTIEGCRGVADVNRVRVAYLGTGSSLDQQQKEAVTIWCDERVKAIKAQYTNGGAR
jgi:hypothetical protein